MEGGGWKIGREGVKDRERDEIGRGVCVCMCVCVLMKRV